jgi:microcystin-dependent protein
MYCRLPRALIRIVGVTVLAGGASWVPQAAATTPYIGQIQFFPYNFSPRGWTACNGQLLSISQFTALFSLYGISYGGDGRTTFGIPDMQGRAPIHTGSGPGLSNYSMGQKSGTATVALAVNQIPSHSHALLGTHSLGNQAAPAGGALARDGRDQTYSDQPPDTDLAVGSIGSTGGNFAHNNMPPYLTLNCNIALNGIYPSRN